jgi:Ca2+-binding RTX toxin-like protein
VATVTYVKSDFTQFNLNAYTTGIQQYPDILSLKGGGFVVAYNNGGDFLSLDFYDASGAIVGTTQVPASAATTAPSGQPSLTQLADGNVVVIWDETQLSSNTLKGAMYSSTGTLLQANLSLGSFSAPSFGQPTVSALANGNFAVAVETSGQIYSAVFGPTGSTILSYNLANTTVAGIQNDAQIVGLNDGYVVIWTDTNPADQQIRGRMFYSSGAPVSGSDFLIAATGDNTQPSIAKLQDGGFVVAYTDSGWAEAGGVLGNGITLQYVSATGVLGAQVHVNNISSGDESDPDVTVLPNGFVLVTWSYPYDPTDTDIRAALFDSSGTRIQVGGANQFTLVNTTQNEIHSTVAGLSNGSFVAGWENVSTTDIVGGLHQIVRLTAGDATDETLNGDELRDIINAGGGNDTINGGTGQDWIYGEAGDDTIILSKPQTAAGNVYDGGTGTDTLSLAGASFDYDFRDDTVTSIEKVNYGYPGLAATAIAHFNADQFGTGISLTATITGQAVSYVFETFDVTMGIRTSLDLSGLTFINFSSGLDSVVIHGDNDAETIIGSKVKDTIYGGGGADYLDGKDGADMLYGGDGDDTFVVDSASDKVFETAGEGSDTVLASASFVLTVGSAVENIATTSAVGASAINLTGNEFAQTITGNAGDNVLDGGGGGDTLVGGLGNDTYIIRNAADAVVELDSQGSDALLAAVSYVLGAGVSVESLATDSGSGTSAINLTGNEFSQSLTGNAGDNVLNGGGGVDTMAGGLGNDTYVVDNAADIVTELGGEGIDTVLTSVSYVLGAGMSVETLATDFAAGTANINLIGNEFSQSLTGNAGANILNGMGGADTMAGGLGNDTYIVDNAGDVIVEAEAQGSDTVLTSVSYTLTPGARVESLAASSSGSTAALKLTGNEFSQSVLGTKGANTLSGLGGNDTLYGFAGSDTLNGGTGHDTLIGGANGDKLIGGTGSDTASYATALQGVVANLTSTAKNTGDAKGDTYSSIENLTGSSKADVLIGNLVANKILGGSGDDKINGGLGKDFLVGGDGKDTFVFDTKLGPGNVDVLNDFSVKSDTIFLDDDIFKTAGKVGQLQASAFHIGKTAEDADDRVLYDKVTGKLWYDADGSGNGSAVHFATLSKGLAMTEADFITIS